MGREVSKEKNEKVEVPGNGGLGLCTEAVALFCKLCQLIMRGVLEVDNWAYWEGGDAQGGQAADLQPNVLIESKRDRMLRIILDMSSQEEKGRICAGELILYKSLV